MKTAQLCIVTGQPLANLIPILQFKPEKVFLAVSEDMREKSKAFKKLLLSLGYQDNCVQEFHKLPNANLSDIGYTALEIISEIKSTSPELTISYNITGGNKLMAIAFFSAISDEVESIFYVDTDHAVIEHLKPTIKSVPFKQVIDVNTYLKAYGKTLRQSDCQSVENIDRIHARQTLTFWLANNVEKLEDAIGCINLAVQSAMANRGQQIGTPVQQLPFFPKREYSELLKKCAEQNLIQWNEEQANYINFHNLEGARYLGGKWLEEYAWLIAKQLDLHDIKLGASITDDFNAKADLRNDLDMVITHNNKMLIIEAKTAIFGKDASKDTNIIDHLDSLGRNAAGVFGKKLLLSAQKLDHTTKKGNRKVFIEDRAKSQSIDTLAFSQIKDLKSYIKNWSGIQ